MQDEGIQSFLISRDAFMDILLRPTLRVPIAPACHLVQVVGAVLSLVGCSPSATESTPLRTQVDTAWVTAEVRQGLDTNGEFVLAEVVPRRVPRLTAESIAVAVARYTGSEPALVQVREQLLATRLAPIAFSQLRPCRRTLLIAVALNEPPPMVPGAIRRAHAPQYAVPLCPPNENAAQLVVTIPDAPYDFTVQNSTFVVGSFRRFGGGNDWLSSGTRASTPSGLIVTPEDAVKAVFMATRRRIARLPVAFEFRDDRELGRPVGPCVSWRVTVDGSARVRGVESGVERDVREFYVRQAPVCGLSPITLFAPTPEQPAYRTLVFLKDTTGMTISSLAGYDSTRVGFTGPGRFEAVQILP